MSKLLLYVWERSRVCRPELVSPILFARAGILRRSFRNKHTHTHPHTRNALHTQRELCLRNDDYIPTRIYKMYSSWSRGTFPPTPSTLMPIYTISDAACVVMVRINATNLKRIIKVVCSFLSIHFY